jgi:acetyl esterase/lipase
MRGSSKEPSTVRVRRGATTALALVVALVCSSCLLTAPTDPGPLRYRDEIFAGVTKTADVVYGAAVKQDGTPVSLYADVYRPTGDTATGRPLVIWIHGGSFKSGSRTSAELVDMATVLGRKGYVGASISYRLSANGCTVIDAACVESIVDATEDAQAAVRFFRQNAATYGIDPDRIAVWGTSAGAITGMNVGYQASVPGNSGTPGVSSTVRSAVSFSGGRLLGTCDEGDAAALLFHGTADPLTPYQWATNTVTCAQGAGLPVHLTTWEGQSHVPYAANRTQIIEETTNFLWNTLALRLIV